MDYKAQTIKNRLSLRQPQADSLEILNKLSEVLELRKGADSAAELAKVRVLYPTCADFERDFPSVCFALATGVGKTRLMGAFISYLFTAKGVKNYFVLVVARDTDHAGEILAMIESDRFFEGRYRGKVMEIHSNQRGGEKEENIQKLLALEKPENQIEIVVHVNMLKEGWDVTNLYTIIPLRAANPHISSTKTCC